ITKPVVVSAADPGDPCPAPRPPRPPPPPPPRCACAAPPHASSPTTSQTRDETTNSRRDMTRDARGGSETLPVPFVLRVGYARALALSTLTRARRDHTDVSMPNAISADSAPRKSGSGGVGAARLYASYRSGTCS